MGDSARDALVDTHIFSWKEVRQHCSKESCWVVINSKVYDITDWLPKHPGGDVVLLASAGLDCTDVFLAYHSMDQCARYMKPYCIGSVEEHEVSTMISEYRELAQAVESSDLMQVRVPFYTKLAVWYSTLLAIVFLCITQWPDNFWMATVVPGIAMGMFFQQIAFIGHDLGHTAVFHCRAIDSGFGILVGNILGGISVGWWKATHNTHHVITNCVVADPDIQHLPFFAVSSDFFKTVHSIYHERVLKFDWASKLLIPLQSRLYYLVMAFARFNLYVQSYLFLASSENFINSRIKTHRRVEIVGLLIFALWFGGLVKLIPFWSWRLLFVLISHGLAGILHVQITLSHFSMPVFAEHPANEMSFLEHQLATSLDVDCIPQLDWFHGGLQFQVAHHLFPRVPRCNLRRLRDLLRSFCTRHKLEYKCVDFVEANRMVIGHLNTVGHECEQSMFHAFINLRG